MVRVSTSIRISGQTSHQAFATAGSGVGQNEFMISIGVRPIDKKLLKMTPDSSPGGSNGSSCPVYPAGDVVLRDGSTVRVRVMRADDEEKLLALFQSLSEDARWL